MRAGKVIYPAVSNWSAWQTQRGLDIQERSNWARLQVIQPMYSLVKRQAEVEILPMAEANGIGVIPYSPGRRGPAVGQVSRPGDGTAEDQQDVRGALQRRLDVRGGRGIRRLLQGARPASGQHGDRLGRRASGGDARPSSARATPTSSRISLDAIKIDMTPSLRAELAELSRTPPPATDRLEEQKAARAWSSMRAKNVMSRPVTIKADATTARCRASADQLRGSVRLPGRCDEKGAMIGIVSEVDLIRRVVGDAGQSDAASRPSSAIPTASRRLRTPVVEVMTREVVTADPGNPAGGRGHPDPEASEEAHPHRARRRRRRHREPDRSRQGDAVARRLRSAAAGGGIAQDRRGLSAGRSQDRRFTSSISPSAARSTSWCVTARPISGGRLRASRRIGPAQHVAAAQVPGITGVMR